MTEEQVVKSQEEAEKEKLERRRAKKLAMLTQLEDLQRLVLDEEIECMSIVAFGPHGMMRGRFDDNTTESLMLLGLLSMVAADIRIIVKQSEIDGEKEKAESKSAANDGETEGP